MALQFQSTKSTGKICPKAQEYFIQQTWDQMHKKAITEKKTSTICIACTSKIVWLDTNIWITIFVGEKAIEINKNTDNCFSVATVKKEGKQAQFSSPTMV